MGNVTGILLRVTIPALEKLKGLLPRGLRRGGEGGLSDDGIAQDGAKQEGASQK